LPTENSTRVSVTNASGDRDPEKRDFRPLDRRIDWRLGRGSRRSLSFATRGSWLFSMVQSWSQAAGWSFVSTDITVHSLLR
jgi:hypothetical protein